MEITDIHPHILGSKVLIKEIAKELIWLISFGDSKLFIFPHCGDEKETDSLNARHNSSNWFHDKISKFSQKPLG